MRQICIITLLLFTSSVWAGKISNTMWDVLKHEFGKSEYEAINSEEQQIIVNHSLAPDSNNPCLVEWATKEKMNFKGGRAFFKSYSLESYSFSLNMAEFDPPKIKWENAMNRYVIEIARKKALPALVKESTTIYLASGQADGEEEEKETSQVSTLSILLDKSKNRAQKINEALEKVIGLCN